MNNSDYQNDLLVLALATGFRGFVKDGSTWLMTIYKGKSLPFKIDLNSSDIFVGNENVILSIIDNRLGLKEKSNNLEKRYQTLYSAFGDENHKFWDIAKSKTDKGE